MDTATDYAISFQNPADLDGKIVLVEQSQFVCFTSWIQFTDAVTEVGGIATVVLLDDAEPATLPAHGADGPDYRAYIPTFAMASP